MVIDLYEYYNVPYGIDYGWDFKPSGVTHVVLFDCSEAQGSKISASETGMNSPILARLKQAVADNPSARVHDITSPPSSAPLNIRLYSYLTWFMDFIYRKRLNPAFTFTFNQPHLMKQMWDGYRRLVNAFDISNACEIRDKVILLGDGDGAYAANAVALMIRRVGLLQDNQQVITGIFSLLYNVAAYDSYEQASRNNFRALRSLFARVDLLALCIDATSKEPTNTIEEDKAFVAKVLEFSRSACAACEDETYTLNLSSCPIQHVIDTVQAELVTTTSDEELVSRPIPLHSEPQSRTRKTVTHSDEFVHSPGSESSDSELCST